MQVYSATQPGSTKKPNEDVCGYRVQGKVVTAIVSDGMTQPLDKNGRYPTEVAALASRITMGVLLQHLSPETDSIHFAFKQASMAVAATNDAMGRMVIHDHVHTARSAATVVATCLRQDDDGCMRGYVASVGDPVGFILNRGDDFELVTHDQLALCHQFADEKFPKEEASDQKERTRARLAWQRGEIRNNPNAKNNAGEKIGFGMIDGNADVVFFINVREVCLAQGELLVLASDAMRVHYRNNMEPSSLTRVSRMVREKCHPLEDAPNKLIEDIRFEEGRWGVRADDATVLIVANT